MNTKNKIQLIQNSMCMIAAISMMFLSTEVDAQDSTNQAKRVIQNKRVKIEIYDKDGVKDTIVEEIITTGPAESRNIEKKEITIENEELKNMSEEELRAYKEKLEMEIVKQEMELEMQSENLEEQSEQREMEIEMEMEKREESIEREMEMIEEIIEENAFNLGNDEKKSSKIKTVEQSWFVVDLGWNVWVTENTFDLPEAYKEMELERGKSVNFHLGIIQQGVNLYKGKLRFVYGLGIEYNNYRFKNSIDLVSDSDPLVYAINSDRDYRKNKLVSLHATMPLMLNFKSDPHDEDEAFKLAAGIQLGYLMSSHIKQKWGEDGRKEKRKIKGDYNLQDYRVGYVVQFGYGDLNIFAKYYPTPVFKEDKGPVANTACVGLVLTPF